MHELLGAGPHRQGLHLEGDVTAVDVLDQRPAVELEQVVTDRDDVTLRHECTGHPLAVDERTVGRSQIDDLDGDASRAVTATRAVTARAVTARNVTDPALRTDPELGMVPRGE